ncbi:uncharacterized protein LOC128556675 [Mercenaria mercenaria]|uniref:uncharacterized protein LOC128556675 n=1 Tax=Mercenaria mercenaria TaxID=6596 RepID=UPI00234E6727|nr:uncharacterized protein LOC128556675 [Mercenaria mercenaria]
MESSSSTSDQYAQSESDFNATARDHLNYTECSGDQNSVTVFSLTKHKRDKAFRRLIIALSKELSPGEFETAKFLFGGEIKKGKMERLKTLIDLCVVLQERCILDENKLGCLLELFEELGRPDLVELVMKYEGNFSDITYATGIFNLYIAY